MCSKKSVAASHTGQRKSFGISSSSTISLPANSAALEIAATDMSSEDEAEEAAFCTEGKREDEEAEEAEEDGAECTELLDIEYSLLSVPDNACADEEEEEEEGANEEEERAVEEGCTAGLCWFADDSADDTAVEMSCERAESCACAK